jgi:hypothetical protein
LVTCESWKIAVYDYILSVCDRIFILKPLSFESFEVASDKYRRIEVMEVSLYRPLEIRYFTFKTLLSSAVFIENSMCFLFQNFVVFCIGLSLK